MLKIDIRLELRQNDHLIIYVCDEQKNVLYNAYISKPYLLYTQEDNVCVMFNASKESMVDRNYYWTISFELIATAPKFYEMIELSEYMPIYATRSLTNYTQYLITKPSGTFEIQYYGTVIIIVPKNSTLSIEYFTEVFYDSNDYYLFKGFDKFSHYVAMSPNYPYNSSVDSWFDWYIYSCKSGMAVYTVTISADIPESCALRFYPDDQPSYELVNTTVYNHILYFKTTNLTLLFNGSECPDAFYTGYTIQIDAEYIARTKTVPYSYTLIIALSCVGFVIVCIFVGVIAIYWIRSRQSRYDKLYKLLKEFNMKPEEIAEMKAKTDVFLIKPGKIHINFDTPLGKGVSSTVYKGRLIGPSSLHEQQNSAETQQFADCDVAIKVINNFGQKEADQLFKEIDAMKKIGFHENLMCMLGWTLSGEIPCLVFEIAQKDLLHYVPAFRDLATEMVPYQEFLSILYQITK
uniref:Protein kinase domain-containing protein n=1 Tax=Acrobeloides nanus TaxID=290746 RepID=A0A914EMQ6_9BILA